MQLEQGWVKEARQIPSPNFNERPEHCGVTLLVIHNISLPPKQFGGDYIELFFQNRLPWEAHPYFKTIEGLEVSAHFLIKRDGSLIQFVSTEKRAWHAGASCFCGVDNCNDYSLGIELEGSDDIPYREVQYNMLARLTRLLQAHYPAISDDRIVGHSDIAPGRKTDPGFAFEWPVYFKKLASLS
ncbi:MAG: 1,6-anhydro-N-acetylmuramyl-L-alanine amidase AmpD [Oleiphilus sp.]|nr:MAG: 1,6-anhydro-N-acetylmuramyl-L-alanine amidase AmpD [Oleiphilus sp.]